MSKDDLRESPTSPKPPTASVTSGTTAFTSSVVSKTSSEVSSHVITKETSRRGSTTRAPRSTTTLDPSGIPSVKICKARRERHMDWPATSAGKNATVPCPEGTTGTAYWFCNASGIFVPSSPCTENCRSRWLDDMEGELNGGSNPLDLSWLLANKTRREEIYGKDIETVLDLARNLSAKFQRDASIEESTKGEWYMKSKNFTQLVVRTYSNLLDPRTESAWRDVRTDEQSRMASKILIQSQRVAFSFGCRYASEMEDHIDFSADNIIIQTFTHHRKTGSSSLRFPTQNISSGSFLQLPQLNWSRSSCPCGESIATGALYDRIGTMLTSESTDRWTINSDVIALSFGNNTDTVSFPEGSRVNITLRHHIAYDGPVKVLCVFWNFTRGSFGDWDNTGCNLVETNMSHTVCACNHLTNFAVLMDVAGVISESDGNILEIISMVFCSLSTACLIATIFCLLHFRDLRCRRTTITCNLCSCLLVVHLLVLHGLRQTEIEIMCRIVAGILSFFLLASFMWMLLEGFHLYQLVVVVFSQMDTISTHWFYLVGYGIPFIIIAISASVRPEGFGDTKYCWLSSDNGLRWTVVGPAAVVILTNLMILIMALRSAAKARASKQCVTVHTQTHFIKGSFSLVFILGITWIFGFTYLSYETSPFAYVFTVLNSLQGVFIFVFQVLLNKKFRILLQRLCRNHADWRRRWMTLKQRSSGSSLAQLSIPRKSDAPSFGEQINHGADRLGQNQMPEAGLY